MYKSRKTVHYMLFDKENATCRVYSSLLLFIFYPLFVLSTQFGLFHFLPLLLHFKTLLARRYYISSISVSDLFCPSSGKSKFFLLFLKRFLIFLYPTFSFLHIFFDSFPSILCFYHYIVLLWLKLSFLFLCLHLFFKMTKF